MAQRLRLEWFRGRLAASLAKEPVNPQPILDWLEAGQKTVPFRSSLIPLKEVRDWNLDDGGNVRHKSGQFFGVEGVHTEAGAMREVRCWDQPIFTQPDGGVLVMVARETPNDGVQFLLQARVEPGNMGPLQLAPSLQSTWSNIRRAHQGSNPPLTELLTAEHGVRLIYSAFHNEEGGRFWQKSNENIVVLLDDEGLLKGDMDSFYWASLSQIKELALLDNLLSPYVKTILAPL